MSGTRRKRRRKRRKSRRMRGGAPEKLYGDGPQPALGGKRGRLQNTDWAGVGHRIVQEKIDEIIDDCCGDFEAADARRAEEAREAFRAQDKLLRRLERRVDRLETAPVLPLFSRQGSGNGGGGGGEGGAAEGGATLASSQQQRPSLLKPDKPWPTANPPCKCPRGLKRFLVPRRMDMICDGCNREFKAGSVMYGCRRCNYDLCPTCSAVKNMPPRRAAAGGNGDGGGGGRRAQ